MNEELKKEIFNEKELTSILDSSLIGLWEIEMNNNTGINKMYCNKTMEGLLGIKNENISPEKVFEHWYTRIHKGYHSYVEKAISKVCSGEAKFVEVQYTWNHPEDGNLLVRCCGTLDKVENGVWILRGNHQVINNILQMKLIMSKSEKDIFEWHEDTKTAYIHTKCEVLDIPDSSLENFPDILVEQNIVQENFKDIFLQTFENVKTSNETVKCELKLRNKNGIYSWYRLTLSKEKEKDSLIIGTIEDIKQLKETEIAYIKGSKFYNALLNETIAYAEINLTQDKSLRMGGIWSEYYTQINTTSYSEFINKSDFSFIYEEDRSLYIATLNKEYLIRSYKKGQNIIRIEARRIINDETMIWTEFTANIFSDPYTKDILALFYLKNIDNCFSLNEGNKLITTVQEKQNSIQSIENEKLLEKDRISYDSIEQVLLSEGEMAYLINPNTYEILEVNELFCKIVDRPKEECVGKQCFSILYDRRTPCNLCKKPYWKFDEFFVWAQYNKVFNKDFLIKNKFVKYKDEKVMLTVGTTLSKIYNLNKSINIENRNNVILDCMNRFPKNDINTENIEYLLDFIAGYYDGESCIILQNNGLKWNFKQFISRNKNKKMFLKEKDKGYFKNIYFKNMIDSITYFENVEDLIVYSYELYKIMFENNVSNLIIIPLKRSNIYEGHVICTNVLKNKIDLEYGAVLTHFILSELIKEKLELELDYSYYHDKLTRLNNRAGYRKYELGYDRDLIQSLGCFCFGINELTHINHTVGIEAGDQVLKDVSNALSSIFDIEKCFRFNGNEFLAIVENLSYKEFLNGIKTFENLIKNLGLSITEGNFWSDTENELNNIINNAIQIRKSKNMKYNQLKNDQINSKRSKLLSEIMIALESDEFEVFLQPKINIKTNKIAGAEALIRRKNNEGGYVPPNKFIPLLEDNHLIQYIDLFVFGKVYKILKDWKDEGKEIFPISLNFSKITLLNSTIIQSVKDVRDKYDIDEKYIEIEVTESIGDIEKQQIFDAIKEIESLGYRILLDDFGVKYSNLSILSEIHFDGLKLDRSIIKDIGHNKTNDIIIKNIISMCKDMNISSIAEGIETKEQEDILKEMNCEIGQGYYYSKPISIPDFVEKYL